MGMVFTYDVTNDASRLLVRPVVDVAELGHGVQYTPMHRFETISGVGNGSSYDDRKGIFEIGSAKFLFYVYLVICKCAIHCIL